MKQTITAIIAGDIKKSTKWCIAALLALPAIVQIPAAHDLISAHPKIATLVASLVAFGTLLHEPVVAKLIGLKETTSVTVGDQTVTATASTTITQK